MEIKINYKAACDTKLDLSNNTAKNEMSEKQRSFEWGRLPVILKCDKYF